MVEKLKERHLLFRIRSKKDKTAFGELYDWYVKKIYRFIYFKVNNREEAEDMTSEVFLKTWNYLIEYKEKEIDSFSGLIYRISRNAVVDYYRQRAKKMEVQLNDEILISDERGQMKVEVDYEIEKLLIVIKKLKQDYQEVLMFKYVEELSVSEIAEILERSQISVRVTLHRAMKKLKEMIGE
jgi:RNA polymerase sigma-70 factor (ECF subfamily)